MINSISNIAPIFLLILSGLIIKTYILADDNFWKAADKIVYYIFFPALLLLKISNADFKLGLAFGGIVAAIISTIFVAIAVFIYKFIMNMENKLFSSVFQGSVRYNSYIFIALSSSYLGEIGVALSGVFIAVMIIFTNIISVIIMNIYGHGGKKGIRDISIKTISNPLILSALLGVLLNIIGVSFESVFIGEYLHYLGAVAMPLSLLSIGAGLVFKFDRVKKIAISFSIFAKLILLPAFAIIILNYIPVPTDVKAITVLYCAVPCAGNAYILSRQMGGDSDAMASIITWGTMLSSISIIVIMYKYTI